MHSTTWSSSYLEYFYLSQPLPPHKPPHHTRNAPNRTQRTQYTHDLLAALDRFVELLHKWHASLLLLVPESAHVISREQKDRSIGSADCHEGVGIRGVRCRQEDDGAEKGQEELHKYDRQHLYCG